jgi:hypothetical protein
MKESRFFFRLFSNKFFISARAVINLKFLIFFEQSKTVSFALNNLGLHLT